MRELLLRNQLDQISKEKLVAKIKKGLFSQDLVLFAYLYGSFIENRDFRDIDIAMFIDTTKLAKSDSDLLQLELSLGSKIDLLIEGYEIDLRCLNYAPLPFKFRVINTGKLLFSKNEGISIVFEAQTRSLYFDFKPHLDFYYQKIVLGK